MSIISLGKLFEEYQPYPKYRNSGVDWLEEIPEQWDIKPIWALFVRKSDKGHEDLQLLSVYRDYGVIPKESRDDNFNKPSLDLSNYLRVIPTDLVTNKMKSWQGSIAISEYEGIVSPAYYTCRAIHREHHKYIHYLLRCTKYVSIYMSLSKGIRVNQWDLEYQSFRNVPVLLPSFNEQQAIADFLDHETARIDELIAKKQRLINLLQEQRTALITNTVTKGLNPDAPMKDSRVEWLGEVPAHWKVKKLSWIFEVKGRIGWRGYTAQDLRDAEDGVLVLGATNINTNGQIDLSSPTYISNEKYEESPEIKLVGGEILIVKVGATIGKVGIVPDGFVESTINPNLMLARSRKENSHYFHYLFNSKVMQEAIGLEKMAGAQDAINQEFISNMRILVPYTEEQQAIVDYLDRETARIDSLIGRINQAIEKLQEYRSALITAAVTGKIDLRGGIARYE
jgi:type I restriction enzyme S subunit